MKIFTLIFINKLLWVKNVSFRVFIVWDLYYITFGYFIFDTIYMPKRKKITCRREKYGPAAGKFFLLLSQKLPAAGENFE